LFFIIPVVPDIVGKPANIRATESKRTVLNLFIQKKQKGRFLPYIKTRNAPSAAFKKGLKPLLNNVFCQVHYPVGIPPFIVIPREDLDKVILDDLGALGIHYRA